MLLGGLRAGGLRLRGCLVVAVVLGLVAAPAADASDSAYDQLATATPPTISTSGQQLGSIPIGPNASLTDVGLTPRGSSLRLSATLKLRCPGGGDIRAGISQNLRFSGLTRWSVGLGGVTGPSGCALADGFALGAGTTADVTLRADGGRLSVAMDLDGTVTTNFVPTATAFRASVAVDVGRSDYAVRASGSTSGATFSGAFASDGTFALDFSLTDIALGKVNVGARGHAARTSPGAPVEISLGASVRNGATVGPGLTLLAVDLGWDRNRLSISTRVRLACASGALDVTAAGVITRSRDYSLNASAQSSACTLGTGVMIDGSAHGRLASTGGTIDYDFDVTLATLDLGWMRVNPSTRMGAVLDRTAARLTNTCDACDDATMRLTAGSGVSVGLDAPAWPVLTLRTRVDLSVDLTVPGFKAHVNRVRLGEMSANGFKLPSSLVLESTLERRIYEVFSTPWGRASGSRSSCRNPNCVTTVAGDRTVVQGAGASSTGRRRPNGRARIMALTVRTPGGRAAIRARLSTPRAVVRMDVQRRRCLAGTCRWALEAYARTKAGATKVARYRSPDRLLPGRYRIVARTGGPESRAVVRTFRVA